MVRGTVEEALNAMLDAEADRLCGAGRYERNEGRMATMSAGEASHWDELHMGWSVDCVNHSECYSYHGKHTNMAENYFSRLRRMVSDQHHHISPQWHHQALCRAGCEIRDGHRRLHAATPHQGVPQIPSSH